MKFRAFDGRGALLLAAVAVFAWVGFGDMDRSAHAKDSSATTAVAVDGSQSNKSGDAHKPAKVESDDSKKEGGHGEGARLAIIFVLLFAIATAVALAARWLKIPYTVALVLTGLLLGLTDAIDAPTLSQDLLFAIFLPGLLFEAAFHLEFKKFWQNKLTVTSLAIPGLIAAIALTAILLVPTAQGLDFVENFTLTQGLVFASLIAATDPIAVVGLFKSLGAPKRLAILVEGESLINDGTAVVIFTLMVSLATGADLSFGTALTRFLVVAGAGVAVGLLFGFAVSWLTHKIDDPMVEITLTTIAAYGAFAVAEHFHLSGVIATVVAGMLCGNYGARSGMSATTKIAVLSFWEYWAFALNSVVFLLIGFQVNPALLIESLDAILVAFFVVLAARVVVVYGVSGLLRVTKEKIPWSWSAVLTWGGLRGGLSMVLVLGLAADFPNRDFLINLTYGVVVLSILVQGITMGPLLRKLGVIEEEQHHEEYERNRGLLFSSEAALEELDTMLVEGTVPPGVLDTLRKVYQEKSLVVRTRIDELRLETEALEREESLSAARHLLLVEKEALLRIHHKGVIGKEVFEELTSHFDTKLLELEMGASEPEEPADSTENMVSVSQAGEGSASSENPDGNQRSTGSEDASAPVATGAVVEAAPSDEADSDSDVAET